MAGDWDLCLIPTVEVPLCNLHREEALDGGLLRLEDLPLGGVAAGARRLPGDLVVQQHRGVPGAPRRPMRLRLRCRLSLPLPGERMHN